MKKKPKKILVPRTRAGGTMTEAQFWSFLRSNLRLASRKWVPRRQALVAVRRPSESDNKRLKWECQCSKCESWFPQKDVEVDHIVPIGSLLSFEDIGGFVERLFCELDGFVVLCKQCHYAKTHSLLEEDGKNVRVPTKRQQRITIQE
jgi:5-methylcytosine-specific restriction endonuclease McrA